MGIGGDLMWGSLAYEIFKKHNRKVIFYRKKTNEKKDKHDISEIYKPLVFCNNPYISFIPKKNNIRIDLDFKLLPEMETPDKWKVDNHIIYHRCKHFGYNNPSIKCYLFPTKTENKKILNVVSTLPEKFIIIEPHAKKYWCAHKQYPLSKWQNIVNEISKTIPVVQMSVPGAKILDNVIDISNKIRNFREACFILRHCKLFVSTEGGLMHGCNAVGGKCLIIYAPLFDPKWTKYEDTEYIWVKDENHYNCFVTGFCNDCSNIMNKHDENIITKKIKEIISR